MAETSNGSQRSAVLLIRVWREEGHPSSFRARVTEVVRSGEPGSFAVVTADQETVIAAVRSWLAQI